MLAVVKATMLVQVEQAETVVVLVEVEGQVAMVDTVEEEQMIVVF